MRSRNVFLLALCQAIGMCGPSIVVLLGGIIGRELAPSASLATLPNSLAVVSTALVSIPSALLMRRIGRRYGFLLAVTVAAAGALLAAYAVAQGSFVLFCLAVFLIGQNNAFVLQYRFAAAESVEPQFSGRAVSFVLLGGILAGYLGPQIGNKAQDWLPTGLYTGSFVALAILYALAILILFFLKDIKAPDLLGQAAGRPLKQIARQPNYLVAVMAGVVSYGLMNFIMTATPVHMHGIGFTLDNTAGVIQSHIIAMYLPSLFSGFLVERFGAARIMQAGAALMLACNLVGIWNEELFGFFGALILLGLGWNLLFVGATVLLTTTYRPTERFKAQATNDFSIFATQAVSSFSAGSVLLVAGWQVINQISLVILLVAVSVIVMQRKNIAQSVQRA
jgi:MFS family permease